MADAPKDNLSANQQNWDKIEGRATKVSLMSAMDAGIRDLANGIVRVATLGRHNADDFAGYMDNQTGIQKAEVSGEHGVASKQAAEHHISERNDATIPGYKRAAGAVVGVAGMWAGMEAGLALGTSAVGRVTGKVVSAVASRIPGARLAGKIPGVSKVASVAKGAVGLAVSGAAGQALAAKGERYVPFGSKSEKSYVWPEGVHAPFSDGGAVPISPHVAAAPVVVATAASTARRDMEVSADRIDSPMPPAQINSPMPPPLPPVVKAADAPAAVATSAPAAPVAPPAGKPKHHGRHRSAMPSTAAVDSKAAQRIAARKAQDAAESKEMAALNRASLRVAQVGDEATLPNIQAARVAETISTKTQSSVARTKQYTAAPDAMG